MKCLDEFEKLHALDPNADWASPYLLLLGADYSIRCADYIRTRNEPRNDKGRVSFLRQVVEAGRGLDIDAHWGQSHFLSNAVFRIASAVEKMLMLLDPKKNTPNLFQELFDVNSKLGVAFSTSRRHLKNWQANRNQRDAFLESSRKSFAANGILDAGSGLVCCLHQWDVLKHRPFAPEANPVVRDVEWYWAIAASGFEQATEMFCESRPHWSPFVLK